MGYGSYLKSPKREEQEVPDTLSTRSQELQAYNDSNEESDDQFMQGFLGCIGDEDDNTRGWEDFMDWEDDREDIINNDASLELDSCLFVEEESQYMSSSSSSCCKGTIKSEIVDVAGFWDIHDEDAKGSLKLNLNYQQVLDAWSDRGPLRAQGCPLSLALNGYYTGEVPVMEEERTARREASVLRYKEKRQSRLFSKKIRYEVRKLNADKRPRLKGRFVKRSS